MRLEKQHIPPRPCPRKRLKHFTPESINIMKSDGSYKHLLRSPGKKELRDVNKVFSSRVLPKTSVYVHSTCVCSPTTDLAISSNHLKPFHPKTLIQIPVYFAPAQPKSCLISPEIRHEVDLAVGPKSDEAWAVICTGLATCLMSSFGIMYFGYVAVQACACGFDPTVYGFNGQNTNRRAPTLGEKEMKAPPPTAQWKELNHTFRSLSSTHERLGFDELRLHPAARVCC